MTLGRKLHCKINITRSDRMENYTTSVTTRKKNKYKCVSLWLLNYSLMHK